MDLKDFIAISGQPGLYKLVNQGKNLLIAENLETGQRIPVHASSHVSSMEEIAVFTESEDKPLKEVFYEIFRIAEGKPALDPRKSTSEEIREYFGTVLPSYDRSKVYVSDMKKVLTWYNILLRSGKVEWVEETQETAPEAESIPGE